MGIIAHAFYQFVEENLNLEGGIPSPCLPFLLLMLL